MLVQRLRRWTSIDTAYTLWPRPAIETEMFRVHDSCLLKGHPPRKQETLPNAGLMLGSVVDDGPTLNQHWVDVACLLGNWIDQSHYH